MLRAVSYIVFIRCRLIYNQHYAPYEHIYIYIYIVTNCSATLIEGPNGSFNVTQPFTCISENIVYGIICKRCSIIYIGETGRRLAD